MRSTPKLYTSLRSFNRPVFAYSGATYLHRKATTEDEELQFKEK
jgi:hypothetical protein